METVFSSNFMLENCNTVVLTGEITSEKAEEICSKLIYLEKKGCDLIVIAIDSPGGSVSAGFKIYDTMNSLNCKIRTIACGTAASMAAFLLSAGSRGERWSYPNADIMIHQPLGGASGQITDMENQITHARYIKQKINEIFAENTNKSIETIKNDTDRDYFLTAQEAVEYGLIDKIVETTNKAKGD